MEHLTGPSFEEDSQGKFVHYTEIVHRDMFLAAAACSHNHQVAASVGVEGPNSLEAVLGSFAEDMLQSLLDF